MCMETTQQNILRFIDRFTDHGKRKEVIDCFTNGCCFWFAETLYRRFEPDFGDLECYVVYDPIANHWACCIDCRVYDITGDITDDETHEWHDWNRFMYQNLALAKRLMRDCINF